MSMLPVRPLGNSGLSVSALGLGAGHIGGDLPERQIDGRRSASLRAIEALLHEALDSGVTLIDTAPSYGASEERLGRLLGSRRHEFVLSTKGGYGVPGVPDWTAAAITLGIDAALSRLRTDVIDVFHLHSCPLWLLQREELLTALVRAQAAGKIRVAAYSGEGEALAHAIACGAFGCVQTSVNLCDQASASDPHLIPAAAAAGIGVIGKRPLANVAWRFADRPSGQYAEVYWDRLQALRPALDSLAEEHDGYAGLALRFAAFVPGVASVIAGVSQPDHLRRNLAQVRKGPLPQAVAAAVQAAFAAHGAEWPGQV